MNTQKISLIFKQIAETSDNIEFRIKISVYEIY